MALAENGDGFGRGWKYWFQNNAMDNPTPEETAREEALEALKRSKQIKEELDALKQLKNSLLKNSGMSLGTSKTSNPMVSNGTYAFSAPLTYGAFKNAIQSGGSVTVDVDTGEEETVLEDLDKAPKRIIPVGEIVLVKGTAFAGHDIKALQEKLNAYVFAVNDLNSVAMLDLDELQELIDKARKEKK
jgi:hypothetical protein